MKTEGGRILATEITEDTEKDEGRRMKDDSSSNFRLWA